MAKPFYPASAEEIVTVPRITDLSTLFPVHDILLDLLATLVPTKYIRLSSYHYNRLLPKLYRPITLSPSLLWGFTGCRCSQRRALHALSHTTSVQLDGVDGIHHFFRATHAYAPYFTPQPVIFPSISSVSVAWSTFTSFALRHCRNNWLKTFGSSISSSSSSKRGGIDQLSIELGEYTGDIMKILFMGEAIQILIRGLKPKLFEMKIPTGVDFTKLVIPGFQSDLMEDRPEMVRVYFPANIEPSPSSSASIEQINGLNDPEHGVTIDLAEGDAKLEERDEAEGEEPDKAQSALEDKYAMFILVHLDLRCRNRQLDFARLAKQDTSTEGEGEEHGPGMTRLEYVLPNAKRVGQRVVEMVLEQERDGGLCLDEHGECCRFVELSAEASEGEGWTLRECASARR
ncbi:hypothetical protein CI109_106243 [Kwoniella shandongensis]|uniref:Uncharacterized protein n=1 Tax=Kwoniella shandongensis TaxID=1734106 RepID=A0AAJ8LR32_9TREE